MKIAGGAAEWNPRIKRQMSNVPQGREKATCVRKDQCPLIFPPRLGRNVVVLMSRHSASLHAWLLSVHSSGIQSPVVQ